VAGGDWLTAGRVGRPHGLDGSFHVSDARPELIAVGAEVRVAGRGAEIVRRAGTEDRPIVRLSGFDGRPAAQGLRGEALLVPRSGAPPLGVDEWWAEDLEGCAVVDGAIVVGEVRRLLALPSCEVLEVARPGSSDLLVPLVRDAIRAVDVDARRIDVDLAFLGEGA
jgi:16S rRNA processing protein RimM